jgi:group I intron endonuclease
MREATIYALLDPITNEVRYIGKANNLKSRLRCHRYEAKSGKFTTRKTNWLKSLGNKEPKVEVLEMVDENTWQEAEKRWISELRKTNKDLTNFADGGQTSPVEGKGHTEETKQKLREAALRNDAKPPLQTGKEPWCKGTKGLMKPNKTSFKSGQSPWNKGKELSQEFCKQMSEARKGKPWSPARRKAQEIKLTKQGI